MAIFSPGALVGAISGSVGGVTFANNKGSKVARIRPARRLQGTEFQALRQAEMNRMITQWLALSDAQRDAWRNAAATTASSNRLGQNSPMNGQQFYIKTNMELHNSAADEIDDPFVDGRSESPRSFSVDLSASGDLQWNGQPGNTALSAIFFVYAFPLVTTVKPRSTRPTAFLEKFGRPSLDQDMRPEIEARWGAPQEGSVMICGLASRQGARYLSPQQVLIETVGA